LVVLIIGCIMSEKTVERMGADILIAIFLTLLLIVPAFLFQPEPFISTESTGHGVTLPVGYNVHLNSQGSNVVIGGATGLSGPY
jgi:hypothetical protein